MNSNTADTGTTIGQLLDEATKRLSASRGGARLDAEVLLARILGKPRSHLYAWPEREVGPDELRDFRAILHRRLEGVPVAYLTGHREFWSLPLQVTPETLIPRPETETLVELALERIPPDTPWRIADLGTGTGAIALAISRERPLCRIIATDISGKALAIAASNAALLALYNMRFIQGNWLEALDRGTFDMILSNPPYIADSDPHLQRGDVAFEPRRALVSGADGLDDVRTIVRDARMALRPGGWLLLEHGHDQRRGVLELLRKHDYQSISGFSDAAGIDRVVAGRT